MKILENKNADRSAFACAGDSCVWTEGLTKREYFAGLAMQGMLANKDASDFTSFTTAEVAIRYADELLEQLGND